MDLSDTALINTPGIISFIVKKIAAGIIVSTSGFRVPSLQGIFKFADANDIRNGFWYFRYLRWANFELTEQTCKVDTVRMKREH